MKLWVMKEILNNIDWDEDEVFVRDENDVLHDILLINHSAGSNRTAKSNVLLMTSPLKKLLADSEESYKQAEKEVAEFENLKSRFDYEMSRMPKVKNHE